jgi:hypothetical protein
MRVVAALAALALFLAPAAYANDPPLHSTAAGGLSGLRVVTLGSGDRGQSRLQSCLANQLAGRTAVARAARKLGPVACEQPPRSQQLAIIVLAGP